MEKGNRTKNLINVHQCAIEDLLDISQFVDRINGNPKHAVDLIVEGNNENAIRLYLDLGFTVKSENCRYVYRPFRLSFEKWLDTLHVIAKRKSMIVLCKLKRNKTISVAEDDFERMKIFRLIRCMDRFV